MDRIAAPDARFHGTDEALQREGIRIVTDKIERITRKDGIVTAFEGGRFEFDEVLSRRRERRCRRWINWPKARQEGFVESGGGQTNLPGLWAAGDITGKFQFTHYAGYQAHHIAKHIMNDACEVIPETTVPWAIFTEPEIGHAGLTEEQARESGAKVKVARLDAADLDWFRTTHQTDGFAKVICDEKSGVLLGAHFICARGSTIVGEACLAIQHGLTAKQVASTIHPYPTASELFRWACAKLV